MSSVAVINPNHSSIDVWTIANGASTSLNLKHSFEITDGRSYKGQGKITVLRVAFELDDSIFVECLSADEEMYYLLSVPIGSEGPGSCIMHVHVSLGIGPSSMLLPRGSSVLRDNNDRSSYSWIFLLFGERGTYITRSLAAPLSRSVTASPSSTTYSLVEPIIRRPTSTARQLNRCDRDILLAIVMESSTVSVASSSSDASHIQRQWLYVWHVEKGPLWRTPLQMNVVDVLVIPSVVSNADRQTVKVPSGCGYSAPQGFDGREVVLDSDSDSDDGGLIDHDTARRSAAPASVAIEPTPICEGGYFQFNEVQQAAVQETRRTATTARFQLQVDLVEMANAGAAAEGPAGISKPSLLQNLRDLQNQLNRSANGAVWRHLCGCLVVTEDGGADLGASSRLSFLQCDLVCVTLDTRPLLRATIDTAPIIDKENCDAVQSNEPVRSDMAGRPATGLGTGTRTGHLLHRLRTLPAAPTSVALHTTDRAFDNQPRHAVIAGSGRQSSNPYHRGALLEPPRSALPPSTHVDVADPSVGASSGDSSTLLLIPRKFNQRLSTTRLPLPHVQLPTGSGGHAPASLRIVTCDRCIYPCQFSFYWTQRDEKGWTVANQIEIDPQDS